MITHHTSSQSPPNDSDKFAFLNLRVLPGKVDYRRAGYILDMEPVAIQRLVAIGLLKPLGNNAGTEHKYFPTQTILDCSRDPKWMDTASGGEYNHALSLVAWTILQSLLIILARCCYIEIQPLAVPLVEAAQVQLQPVPHLAEAYSNLQLSHRISLADAFQLCSALTTGGSEFASLRDELNNGTEGFRDALLRIRQVETTSRKGGV